MAESHAATPTANPQKAWLIPRNLADIIVKGTVADSKGLGIPGATVKNKATGKSVATDANGDFSIAATSGNDVLVISFVGYKTQEITIGNRSSIKITLAEESTLLNEVVAVGFGAQRKRDLTGSVVSVKAADITARPGPNPIESLQGRVAGLDITRSSGQAGAGVNLQLRGTRSFTASGNPLFIINGLPGDYATLNANDIESIEVLKDASSTAVYGSAGANGVVIITTKSGKDGKMNIDLNSYYGYNGFSITPKIRTGEDYLQAKRDAYSYVYDAANSKWTTTGALWQSPADDATIFGAQRYALYQQGQFVDWAKEFLQKDAATQDYSLAVSGGNKNTKAYVSFNLQDEKGQYKGDDYKNYSTSIRIDHRAKDWISIGTNLQASYVIRNKAQDKLENALVTDPLVRPYNVDGTLNTDLGNNVYNLLLNYQPGVYANLDNNTKVFFNPYVELRPVKGLTVLSRAGVHMDYSNTYQFNGIGSVAYVYNNANIAKASIDQNRYIGLQWENVLTYNLKLAQKHELTFTGVTSYYYNQNTNTQMNQSNITSNNFEWYKFTGDQNSTAISSYTMSKTFGLVGRVNYSYLGKYLFQASIRRDGASVLYSTNRWDNFPALSAGWRISEEKFMAFSRPWLDNLKLRASWGIAGTAKIDPYSSVSNVESNNASLGGTTVPIYRSSPFLTNPDLHWEKSHNTNIGLDANLFNNRIDLAVDYYITNTDGVIYSVSEPSIYGTYKPGVQYQTYLNIAQTNNKGFEVALNTRNIVTKDFEWSSNLTYSINRESILKIVGGLSNNIANTNTPYTLSIGQPVNSFFNYKLDGVWQIGEEVDAAAFGKRPGDLKVNVPGMTHVAPGVYSKQAADGTTTYYYANLALAKPFNSALTAASAVYNYSSVDYQTVGHNSPNWSLGFQNQFKYKNFDLTVYAYMRWGQTISYNMMGWYQPNSFATNASPSRTFPVYFNYWTPTNPSNDFPVMNYLATSTTMVGFSGLNYVDGSFFKIKNITLGYTLPTNWAKKIFIQRLRIYSTVTNPLIIAKSHLLKQYDPEMNGSLAYPLTKQVVFGLNVTL
ncbi:TonB-dependent receptor [Mucilaginibacter boryungensis]|uniref:TonB-dependent receptor n=2 Tax=Mucilaginibacter boryungensis TaxID=768480 RepID=A0ABR9XIV9_9SPHI|nr:TonB-dependent receptor [Mucilaginibacter boryungensis]